MDTTASKFAGTWELVTIEDSRSDDRMGHEPRGLLMYDGNGYMAVQTMRTDRPRFASDNVERGAPKEVKAAFDGYTAYFGTYTIDEKAGTIAHHVQGSVYPNNIGRDLIRYFEFSGSRLILMPAVVDGGRLLPKSPLSRRLIWERVGRGND